MSKQKPGAQIKVADGTGGMRLVSDLRFDAGEWPLGCEVSEKFAERWFAHLTAEVEDRGWNSSGISQLNRFENGGTLSVHTANGPTPPSIDIVWEKQRGAALVIKARPSGSPALSLETAREFIDAINVRQRANKTRSDHRWAALLYDGLPWRGELWLSNELRLGPPSKYPTDALLGPQAIIVDAIIEGIGWQGITAGFQTRLQELRIFLSIVLGLHVTSSKFERGWVSDVDEQLRITDCRLGHIGYTEISKSPGFPSIGGAPDIERRVVRRPGLGQTGIWPDMLEQRVPADIEELWRTFIGLPAAKREHFMRAGNAFLIARSMWPDQRTAYAAFLVVACESLKPSGRRYERSNIYDVVASLIAPSEGERLQELAVRPQRVRSKHVHRGELAAGELLPMLIQKPFEDPSFDEMIGELTRITRTCLIEWLRQSGDYNFIWMPRVQRSVMTRVRSAFLRIYSRIVGK